MEATQDGALKHKLFFLVRTLRFVCIYGCVECVQWYAKAED